jgi:nitrite reductase/ring-hydroxylating ferredoxin subunit
MAVVGKASEMQPGTIRSFDLNGESVAVANVGGAFHAFSDTCTHRGCSLSEGNLEGNVVTCFCHGGQFDVTNGEVVGGPPPEPVKTYATSVENGNVVIT